MGNQAPNDSASGFDLQRVDQVLSNTLERNFRDTGTGQSLAGSFCSTLGIPTNTMIVMERLANHLDFKAPVLGDLAAPYGRFRHRHIIGTGTRVLGGVFLGHSPREALVVDLTDPKLQKRLRFFIQTRIETVRQLHSEDGLAVNMSGAVLRKAFVQGLPQALFDFTRTHLVYDESRVAQIFREAKLEVDSEFSLDHYLRAHYGVCRQMVLFLVAMFELLEKQELTEGRMFLARCYIPHFLSHAWARHELPDGSVLILDPALNYFGPLDQGGDVGKFVYGHECAKVSPATSP